MKIDRKSVKRNLMNLIDFGYDIEYSESIRLVKDKNGEEVETKILSDFYLNRSFTDGELQLLIDSVLFSNHISYSQCRDLVEKLEELSNIYFRSRVKHIRNLPENRPSNSELFMTIETLDKAISRGLQVSFTYNSYDIDKKLHPRRTSNNEVRNYIINPYQIVATNVCNYEKYDNVSHYRLDRIANIKLLDTPAKPQRMVKGIENGLDLPKHLAEHLYMFAGESVAVKFIAKRYIVTDVIDWFGKDIKFSEATDDEVTLTVKVNPIAMKMWALKYSRHIRVISRKALLMKLRLILILLRKIMNKKE